MQDEFVPIAQSLFDSNLELERARTLAHLCATTRVGVRPEELLFFVTVAQEAFPDPEHEPISHHKLCEMQRRLAVHDRKTQAAIKFLEAQPARALDQALCHLSKREMPARVGHGAIWRAVDLYRTDPTMQVVRQRNQVGRDRLQQFLFEQPGTLGVPSGMNQERWSRGFGPLVQLRVGAETQKRFQGWKIKWLQDISGRLTKLRASGARPIPEWVGRALKLLLQPKDVSIAVELCGQAWWVSVLYQFTATS